MKQSVNWRAIFYINGCLLLGLALMHSIPMIYEWIDHIYDGAFVISFLISLVLGGVLVLGNYSNQKMKLGTREAFLITVFVWIILSLFAAVPFYLKIKTLSFVDSCFESISALTTTGVTLFKDVDHLPRGIHIWRSLLQWIGGIGIIVIAMSFFPALRLGGMQLFRSEFSDRYEKILPRVSQIASSLVWCYVGFSVVCFILYYWLGMSSFDAFCHALSTISTGGLSTHTEGLIFYNHMGIECVAGLFMIIGGTTLILFVRFMFGDPKALFKDSQFKTFLGMILFFGTMIALWNWSVDEQPFIKSVRYGFFNVIGSITTTGYFNTDITRWHSFAHMIFFMLGCIGGCTGSTAGGIKIFRVQVLLTIALHHMRVLRRPNLVLIPKFQGYKITDAVAFSILTLITLYMISLLILSCLLSATGFDFLNAISASGSVLGNVGITLMPLLTKGGLSISSKFILMIGMIAGRLELLTVFILFQPSFWRN